MLVKHSVQAEKPSHTHNSMWQVELLMTDASTDADPLPNTLYMV